MTEDFWLDYDKMVQEEEGPGGGAICHATIQTGFKVYPEGVPQSEAWFPFVPTDKAARKEMRAAAQAVIDEHGLKQRDGVRPARPEVGIMIVADNKRYYKQGEKMDYEDARYFWRPNWTEKNHPTLREALSKQKTLPLPWSGWVRLAWVPNPHFLEQGDEEKARDKAVVIPSQVFKNAKAALAAVKEMPTGSSVEELPVVPEGFGEEDWQALVDGDIKDMLGDEPSSEDIMQVANDFGVDPSYIQAVADSE